MMPSRLPLLLSAAVLTAASSAFAADGTYTNTASGGSWETTTNWAGGIVADGAGSTADFSTLDITTTNTVTLGSAHTLGTIKFGDTNNTNTWTLAGQAITLNNGTGVAAVIDAGGASTNSITSALSIGTAGLSKTGGGTLTLSGNVTGSTGTLVTVQGGTLILATSNGNTNFNGNYQVNTGATLQIAAGGNIGSLFNTTNTTSTLTLDGGTVYFNRGTTGTVLRTGIGGASGLVKINGGNGSQSGPAGFTQTSNGIISGGVSLQVTANPVTLGLVNTYTGTTTVTAGTLTVSGAINIAESSTGVNIASGATLTVSGTLKALSINSRITNAGTLNLSSGTDVLDLSALIGVTNGQSYQLITNTGTINGNFNSILGPSGFTASLDSGTGFVTFTAVPEPSTYGLLGAGALAGVAFVRRRRHRS